MGTRRVNGAKPSNKVTISRGGDVPPRKVEPSTGKTDRSFAQPNPAIEHNDPEAKPHASASDAVDAIERNSTQKRTYSKDADDAE